MLGVNEVVRFGALAALFAFAFLLFLAYRQQKEALARLRDVKVRLDRLSTLVEALGEEKKVIAGQIDKKVERHSLSAILEQTVDALYTAMPKPEVAVVRARQKR
jgi:signal transduction histidine kinase